MAGLAAQGTETPWNSDQQLMLEGVKSLAVPGTPGTLALWRKEAIPLVLDGAAHPAVVVAAAPFQGGRLAVFTHHYVSAGALAAGDTARFMRQVVTWCAGATQGAIGVTGGSEAAALKAHEIPATDLGADWAKKLQGIRVLLHFQPDLSAEQITAINAHLARGGGLVVGMCPWGCASVKGVPVQDLGLTRFIAPSGITFTGGYAHADDAHFRVAGFPEAVHNGALAGEQLRGKKSREALRALLTAIQWAPEPEVAGGSAPAVPVIPGIDKFPGKPQPTSPRITRSVTVNPRIPRWHSTGLYAAPGEEITITIPAACIGERWSVRIGCHTDGLWHREKPQRVPEISLERSLAQTLTRVRSPFGGLIYVDVPEKAHAPLLDSAAPPMHEVVIAGAVETPYFELGTTTPEEWARQKQLDAPWAEFATSKVVVSVPVSAVRDVDDPRPVLEFWDRVIDAASDLRGWPRERPYPHRYVTDIEISAGYMHSGYPIMTHLDAATDMTHLANLQKGPWGLFHELGHNHQHGDWTFEGTGEVTCNLWSLYLQETCCNVYWRRDEAGEKDRRDEMAAFRATGCSFEEWKKRPFLALTMYEQLKDAFGWAPIQRVLAAANTRPQKDRPKDDDAKRDLWMTGLSLAVGHDLGPFFEVWGVPVSKTARERVQHLPAFVPVPSPRAQDGH
jgi:hypothetical protein